MTDQWTPSDEPTPPTPATFSARMRLRRGEILRIGVVIGSLVVLVASAAVTMGASPSTSADPAGGAPSSSPGASDDHAKQDNGLPGFRFGGPAGPGGLGAFGGIFGGPSVGGKLGGNSAGIGRSITIAKIDGSNVSLKTDDGWTRTIAVTDTTEIRIGSQVGKLSDLNVGDEVSLREKKNADGTYTITLIVVRVPTIAGTVTDVSSSGFTVKLRDGSSKTVTVSGSTSFLVGTAKSSKADLSVGARVQVEGTDGTPFAATVVHIVPDVRIGKVTATTSTTITIEVRGGKTTTIHVDAATTYKILRTTTAKLSDVTVGMYVSAQGLSRADGSLDATSVTAGTLRGPKLPVKPDASPPSS
jgi:hypothetical protein